MNTTKSNELLAEFLGFEKVKFLDNSYVFIIPDNLSHNEYKNLTLENDEEVVAWSAEHLLFHKDWNWLMQVVGKIENLENSLKNETNEEFKQFQKILSLPIYTKIEAVYNACVEFVKWYNQNEKRKKF